MIIWGRDRKSVRRNLGNTSTCPQCGHTKTASVVVDYDYNHLYGLFRYVHNVRTSLSCDSCGFTQVVDKREQRALFAELGGNPIPFMDRYGGSVLLLIVAGSVAYAFLSQASRDISGNIVKSGAIDIFEIRPGDCYDDGTSDIETEYREFSDLYVVPCANPHDNEIFAIFELDIDTYPGREALYDIAYDKCIQRFEDFVGRDFKSSSLDVDTFWPTETSWTQFSDREVVCAVYDIDGAKMSGTAKGSGI